MNDIHTDATGIQMQLVYIVILSATGYRYSIIDSILARRPMYSVLSCGRRSENTRHDTIGPMPACKSRSVCISFISCYSV